MDNINSIHTEDIKKKYNLYARPQDRFREAVGISRKSLHTDFYALNGISFEVAKGETVGIIGTNGSGKSTLLKILTGVLKPTTGVAHVEGRVSALLELGAGFNQEYTGIENIYLNGRMMGYTRKEMEKRVSSIIEFAEIGDFIHQPVKTYSSGMFARLAFAVAINVEPDILIVDEALSVGDIFFQNKCFRKFKELKDKGVTILFVSHDISSVRQMCSRVLWIDKGIQKIFAQSDLVCDMYMDTKRQDMNQGNMGISHKESQYLTGTVIEQQVAFPKIQWKNSSIVSDKVRIESMFLTDSAGGIVESMHIEERYAFHVVVRLMEDMDELIMGIVVENNKGIPLYDFNNYINSGKVIEGKKGQIIEVIFSFWLPRIMKGVYLVAAAVAQGTQNEHVMLSWLHGVQQIEIINPGYNSSYIEIQADVKHNVYEAGNVEIV
jgi:ABC-type polysaccharide/polyol phosphate transport system ATPase subunit|nr:ABC transporter ATP-binding protein [uncultured Acetatifactor sp.]